MVFVLRLLAPPQPAVFSTALPPYYWCWREESAIITIHTASGDLHIYLLVINNYWIFGKVVCHLTAK